MNFFKIIFVVSLLNLLIACTNDKNSVALSSQPPMATGGQDAALFAAKTY